MCNCPGWDDPDRDVITISPFRGGCDICPIANSCSPHLNTMIGFPYQVSVENVDCARKSLYPMSTEELKELLPGGYQDTLRFLKREGDYILVCSFQATSQMQIVLCGNYFVV